MDKNFIVLWAVIFISFVLGMLCERILTKKTEILAQNESLPSFDRDLKGE